MGFVGFFRGCRLDGGLCLGWVRDRSVEEGVGFFIYCLDCLLNDFYMEYGF